MENVNYIESNYSIKSRFIPIYEAKVIYCEYKEGGFNDLLSKLNLLYGMVLEEPSEYEKCYGFCQKFKVNIGFCYFVFINTCDEYKSVYINTFTHEVYHLIEKIKEHHGLVAVEYEANEHIAYLTGYINELLLNRDLIK